MNHFNYMNHKFVLGCESFCGAFFHVMKHAKSISENHVTRSSQVNPNELLAFTNPADPSEIYVTQPILNQTGNFNNTTIDEKYNLEIGTFMFECFLFALV
jgi:hypothetical protein